MFGLSIELKSVTMETEGFPIEAYSSTVKQSRRWVFTINNYTEEDVDAVKALENDPVVQAIIAEYEHINGEGTPHIQGYVEFNRSSTRKTVENKLGGRAWIAAAKGNRLQCYSYCTKEEQRVVDKGFSDQDKEVSKKYVQKKDQEAALLIEDIKRLTPDEMESIHPWFMLYKRSVYFEYKHEFDMQHMKTYDGDLQRKNLWIYGVAGVGKSFAARQGVDQWKVFNKPYNKWWGGWNRLRHDRVIIEDWPSQENGGEMLLQHLKIWADRYPFTGEVKGGQVMIAPGDFQLIITSNFKPEQCFRRHEDILAIRRRFTFIRMTEPMTQKDPFDIPVDEIENPTIEELEE